MLDCQRCHYCGREFVPDPRVKTPKACFRKRCRKTRRREADMRWRKTNPTIDVGRYPNTRQWLAKHPGYLRRYRIRHPESVAADNAGRRRRHARVNPPNADIQDEIRRRKIAEIRALRGADIQDVMRRQIDGVLSLLAPAGGADIQDVIDRVQGFPVPLAP